MATIREILYNIPAILVALTVHEFFHGLTAHLLGDPTPKRQGRLTLNPLAHLDPLGTLLLLVAKFGWAKPVEVNPMYFRGNRQRGFLLVSLAGPASNIVLAFVAGILYFLVGPQSGLSRFIGYLLIIDVYLALFNLLPIPPLDGSNILLSLLPAQYHERFYQLQGYGTIVLMLLIVTNITGRLLVPVAEGMIEFILLVAYLITG
jgi:Zn-dependent protease